MLFLFGAFAIVVILTAVFFAFFISVEKKYQSFVLQHSIALHQLQEINGQYKFQMIPPCMMETRYDNRHYFDSISPEDYLTYQLITFQIQAQQSIKDAFANSLLYDSYQKEIVAGCTLGKFDTDQLLKNETKLRKTEKELFDSFLQSPVIIFSITVRLWLTDMRGRRRGSKCRIFLYRSNRKHYIEIESKAR